MNIDKFKGQNIFWLASCPKSGSTMLRLILSLYFFTDDGTLNDFKLINNINTLNNYYLLMKKVLVQKVFLEKVLLMNGNLCYLKVF